MKRVLKTFTAMLLLASNTACTLAPGGGGGAMSASRSAYPTSRHPTSDALAEFLDGGSPGSSGAVAVGPGGEPAVVTIEREYHAASGRLCRRLRVVAAGAPAGQRIACRDRMGGWELLPALSNRALPALVPGTGPAGGPPR